MAEPPAPEAAVARYEAAGWSVELQWETADPVRVITGTARFDGADPFDLRFRLAKIPGWQVEYGTEGT